VQCAFSKVVLWLHPPFFASLGRGPTGHLQKLVTVPLQALKLADPVVILDTGHVVYDDSAQKVLDDEALRAQYLDI